MYVFYKFKLEVWYFFQEEESRESPPHWLPAAIRAALLQVSLEIWIGGQSLFFVLCFRCCKASYCKPGTYQNAFDLIIQYGPSCIFIFNKSRTEGEREKEISPLENPHTDVNVCRSLEKKLSEIPGIPAAGVLRIRRSLALALSTIISTSKRTLDFY